MTFPCGCGAELALSAGRVACAGCGAAYEARPGWRSVKCECGARVLAAPGQVGVTIPCNSCHLRVDVPPDAPSAPPALVAPPRPRQAPRAAGGDRDRLRWIFLLALLPLLVHVFTVDDTPGIADFIERARHDDRIRSHPTPIRSLEEVFRLMEVDRVEGAYASRFSMAHWVYAMAAAALFWGLILGLFPLGRAHSLHLWTVGLLMGTFGVLFLLLFQELAKHPLLFVGRAYEAAFDPRSGFFKSLFGFLLGVGLCEEFIKLLPLALVLRRGGGLDVHGAVAWGLAMGAGFGVSEGIHYAGNFYNGFSTGRVYVVRFLSCVALHMVWSGAAAARLSAFREDLENGESRFSIVFPLVLAAAPSIALHAIYNTLFKHGADVAAFCFALVSVLLFYWTVDRRRAVERAAA